MRLGRTLKIVVRSVLRNPRFLALLLVLVLAAFANVALADDKPPGGGISDPSPDPTPFSINFP